MKTVILILLVDEFMFYCYSLPLQKLGVSLTFNWPFNF